MKLNDKQRKFCEFLAKGKNKAEAYRMAYKSKGSAASCASCANKLLKNADSQAYLCELRNENRKESRTERKDVLDFLAVVMSDGNEETRDRISAAKEISKMCGYYEPEKVETSVSFLNSVVRNIPSQPLKANE